MNKQRPAKPAQVTCINLIRLIAQELCLHPESIKVAQDFFSENTIEVQVHASDMGALMGEKGAHKNLIFALVNSIAARNKISLSIRFLEPVPGPKERYPDFAVVDPWDSTGVIGLAREIASALLSYPADVTLIDGEKPEDRGKSKIEIIASAKESQKIIEALNVQVASLFRGIGRKNGRYLTMSGRVDARDDVAAGPTDIPDWDSGNW